MIGSLTLLQSYAVRPAATPNRRPASADWESRLCQGYGAINAAFGDNWGSAAWTPDFSKLAVMVYGPTIGPGPARSNTDIFVLSVGAATAPLNVTAYPGPDQDPAWSPDSKRLAFTRDFSHEIFVIDADGKNRVSLEATGSDLTWSPDGSKIAFVDPALNLFVMSSKGGRPHKLPQSHTHDQRPAWSPDGSRIAFLRGEGPEDHRDLWIVNADGSNGRLLCRKTPADRTPLLWSADGLSLAFSGRDGSGNLQIFVVVVQPGSAETKQLTRDSAGGWPVCRSPDGRRIAYLNKHASGAGELDVVDVRGGTVRRLCPVAY